MSASAAAITTLLRPPPRVHPASPLPMHALPFLRCHPRPVRSLTTACAFHPLGAGAGQPQGDPRAGTMQRWTRVRVADIAPATEDESIFLITLDLSRAPDLVKSHTTPGQYLQTRVPDVPSGEFRPADTFISSPPRSGLLKFDLLVRSVPGTTSELLCKLHKGDVVELGPVRGLGIKPPAEAETVLLFAVGEGISPIRSLIESNFASKRYDVRLFYAAKDLQSMPYQERFEEWKKTGVKILPLTPKILDSTGAVIIAPRLLKEVSTRVLQDLGMPHDNILTINNWSPVDPFAHDV